jgi:molybdenum cofactor biosynthesis enzyme MoaA
MTSNGIALPRKLPKLVAAGLTHLNVSLDTLDPFKFELMTRRRGHATVLKVLEQASALLNTQATGIGHLRSLKLNVVIMNKVNDEEVINFVELTKDLPISIRFIEYMPFDGM